jgi:tetratricopeptide (TPR) repeat protein/acyl carrier protein
MSSRYASMATDNKLSEQQREAAMLYSAAEKLASDGGEAGEVEKMATQAQSGFKDAGDRCGFADSSCLLVNAKLKMCDGVGALQTAKDAYALMLEMKGGQGSEAAVLALVVDSYLYTGQSKKAMRTAKAGISLFNQKGQKSETCVAMNALAKAQESESNFEGAMETLDDALGMSRMASDKKSEAMLLGSLSLIHERRGEIAKAVECAEELAELHHKQDDFLQEASALTAYVSKLQCSSQDFKAAHQTAQRARDIAEKANDERAQAKALLASYEALMRMEKPRDALKDAREAQELFDEAGDKKGEAEAFTCIGACYKSTEQYRLATRAAQESYELKRVLGDGMGMAASCETMASIHLMDHRPKEALKIAQEGVKIAKYSGDETMSAKLELLIVQSYADMLQYFGPNEMSESKVDEMVKKAGKAAQGITSLSAKACDASLEAELQYSLASVYASAGRIKECTQAAMEALSLFKSLEDKKGLVRAQAMVGQAMMLKQNTKKAKSFLDDALELVKEIEYTAGQRMVEELIKESTPKKKVVQSAGPVAASTPVAQAPVAASGAAPAAAVSAYVGPDPSIVKSRIITMMLDMTGQTDQVEADTPFMDAGIDSLASVELRTNLQQTFGVPLPSTVMFNFPTTSSMTNYLIEEMTEKQIALK